MQRRGIMSGRSNKRYYHLLKNMLGTEMWLATLTAPKDHTITALVRGGGCRPGAIHTGGVTIEGTLRTLARRHLLVLYRGVVLRDEDARHRLIPNTVVFDVTPQMTAMEACDVPLELRDLDHPRPGGH